MLFKIREAEQKDEEAIKELCLEMLRTIYKTDGVKGYDDDYFDKYWDDSENLIYVAEDADYTLGYVSVEVYRQPQEYIYLDDMSVTERARGNGIGTKFFHNIESYARKIEIPNIIFHVEKSNVDAQRLYERLGYKIYKDQGHRYLMRKQVW